jgi:arylsulfatase A-like enzyme
MKTQVCPLFRAAVLLSAGISLISTASAAEKPARPPNIVLILADDLGHGDVQCLNPQRGKIKTPHLDRLAAEGMTFTDAHSGSSVCTPTRYGVLTGRYAWRTRLQNGVLNGNTEPLIAADRLTVPGLLKQHGYHAACIGKWHLESDPTGFDHWHILPGQGRYCNPPMIRDGQRVQHTGYTTDLIADFSIEWPKNRDKSKPFLLMSQHKAPHREWSPALRHLGWNGDREFPEPKAAWQEGR